MSKRKRLTTESGAPVADNQNSQTAGPRGPVLLQDQHLLEKLARFNRERIPERVVHARRLRRVRPLRGHRHDVTRYTRAAVSAPRSASGPRCSCASRPSPAGAARPTRCATRAASRSSSTPRTATATSPATTRRSSSSAIRSSSPTSSTRQKPDPYTNQQEPENVWDFFSLSPEATHQFTWLFGDRGIPATLPPHGRLRLAHLPVGERGGRARSG